MKTAISLPNELSASADALAKRLGLSRSALVAAALREFVAKHRASKVAERLDAVYAAEDSRLPPPARTAQRRAVTRSPKW
jgi:metal-responsive CopG/Arc/MetJ family transcriptional regulator